LELKRTKPEGLGPLSTANGLAPLRRSMRMKTQKSHGNALIILPPQVTPPTQVALPQVARIQVAPPTQVALPTQVAPPQVVSSIVFAPFAPRKSYASALKASPTSDVDPVSYRDALSNPLESTFTPVADTNGMKPIGCRWVYKTKRNPNGTIRYKVRLVIEGYEQIRGIDFDETYAPVSKLITLRYLLSFAAQNNYKIGHLDVVTVFLNPEIDTKVYMQLLEASCNRSDSFAPTQTLWKSSNGLCSSTRCRTLDR
jgi:hypothetical protein